MENYYINNRDTNDIYLYFQMVRQIEPVSILDIGMLLKRCGAISRQVVDQGIPGETRLDGIDFKPELELPIYSTIYNHITSLDSFLKMDPAATVPSELPDQYDLALLLCPEPILSETELSKILLRCSRLCKYLVIPKSPCTAQYPDREEFHIRRLQELHVEENTYYLFFCDPDERSL